MEVYLYKCAVCGYIHQVPSYWMGYAPEEKHEQMHFSPATRELCENAELDFDSESKTE